MQSLRTMQKYFRNLCLIVEAWLKYVKGGCNQWRWKYFLSRGWGEGFTPQTPLFVIATYVMRTISGVARSFKNSWLVVQNLKIARSRGFIFPEAFRLTLVKGIVRIKNVELRPLIKARERKREVVSDWTKSVDQSKTEALVRDFQRVDKLLLPAQDWSRNFDVSGF